MWALQLDSFSFFSYSFTALSFVSTQVRRAAMAQRFGAEVPTDSYPLFLRNTPCTSHLSNSIYCEGLSG